MLVKHPRDPKGLCSNPPALGRVGKSLLRASPCLCTLKVLKNQDETPNLPPPDWLLGVWVPRELQWELCQGCSWAVPVPGEP